MGLTLSAGLILLTAAPSTKLLLTAIERFQSLDDDGASTALAQVLAGNPDVSVAAKAHIYLGLIALNAADIARVRKEFREALTLDAVLELPREASPKARFVFRQVRAELEAGPVAAQAEPPATPAPAPSSAEPPSTVVVSGDSVPDRVPGLVAGGVAIAALAVGIGFGVAQGGAISTARNSGSVAGANAALANVPMDGWVADACFAGAAALGVTAAVLFFVVRKTPSEVPAVAVSPTPGGARVLLETRF